MAVALADEERVARALGWFSVGLGLTEVAVARTLAHLIGAPPRPALLRLYGLREIAAGIGILTRRRPSAGSGPGWRATPWISRRSARRSARARRDPDGSPPRPPPSPA